MDSNVGASTPSPTPTPITKTVSTTLTVTANVCPSGRLPLKRKAKGGPSGVWDHFTRVEGCPASDPKVKCNYCGKIYACHSKRNDTATMSAHLSACTKNPHRKGPMDKYQQTLAGESQPEGVGESMQSNLNTLVTHKYTVEGVRLAIAEMVIVDELPFRVVEGQGFRKVCWSFDPRFKVPSRVTVARDCMKLFQLEKEKLKQVFRQEGMRVCLTTDTWTSVQNLNYMCLTAHFIDMDWKLHKKILNFCLIPNHRGDTIERHVESCLLDWGIERIFTVTVDNASSNDLTIEYLRKFLKENLLGGKYLHMRCCAHILNRIVNDGLMDCDDAIKKVRNAVRYVRSSPARTDKFKKCAEKEKIDCKKMLCLDVSTRWNSTYLMLEAAEKFQKAFLRMEDEDEHFLRYFHEGQVGPPGYEDWERVRVLVRFLKIFYDSTTRLSGSLYLTANTCFQELCSIQKQLIKMSANENYYLKSMAVNMKKKYDKYWGSLDRLNLLLLIAVVL